MASKRALILLLISTLVVVASLTLSTSAFTASTLDRTAQIRIASDTTALLALVDGHPNSEIVQQADGALTIDFGNAGSSGGVPPGIVATLGSTTSPASDHAFRIVNQGTQPRDVTVRYTIGQSATDEAPEARNLQFKFYHDQGADGSAENVYSVSELNGDNSVRIPDVAPNDVVYVVIVFDTNGLTAQSDLSGSLRIVAGEG